VALSGLRAPKDNEDRLASEARLLYVGMTRARRQLLVTSSGENRFTPRLAELAGEVA